MSGQDAIKSLNNYLTEFEKKEVVEYQTIYYFNVTERQKWKGKEAQLPGGLDWGRFNKETNNGFDTDQQEYHVRYNDHIDYRYEVVKKLGKGSFGIVLRCFDHKQKEFVALKILKNKKRLYEQGLVEAKLIETLNKKDPEDKKNIIKKLDQFVFRKHLVITFELLSVNLYDFIKMNNFQGFSLSLIKRFAIQILISLYFLRENNIVHCDLKPENILLRKINKSGIKIIDFGSGCFENEKIYTYI
jgi:dual specificity tyrosine-phosphorylation-regulated kinase 2/3/4